MVGKASRVTRSAVFLQAKIGKRGFSRDENLLLMDYEEFKERERWRVMNTYKHEESQSSRPLWQASGRKSGDITLTACIHT